MSEKNIGETKEVVHTYRISNFLAGTSANTYISKGGSLCKDLRMTPKEALTFAKNNHLKHYHKDGKLFVLVYPGDTFCMVNGSWNLLATSRITKQDLFPTK